MNFSMQGLNLLRHRMIQDHSHWNDRPQSRSTNWVHIEIKPINLPWVIPLMQAGVRQSSTLLGMVSEVILCLSRRLNSTFKCRAMGPFTGSHWRKKGTHITTLMRNRRNPLQRFVLLKNIPAIKVCVFFITFMIDFGPSEVNLVKIVDPVLYLNSRDKITSLSPSSSPHNHKTEKIHLLS